MKEVIQKIKTLRSIKADAGFVADLHRKVIIEAGVVTNMLPERLHDQQGIPTLYFIRSNLFKNMFIPLLIIIGILGGGAGATYASQSSLPGDVLYPVKIVSEKAQVAFVTDDVKEAQLHLKFSSKRLGEIEELSHEGKKDSELVKLAIENYKEELARAQAVWDNTSASTTQAVIAQNVADVVSKDKATIARVSKDFEDDNDILELLDEAWEDAIEHGDIATIALLQNVAPNTYQVSPAASSTAATSTVSTIENLSLRKKVLNKIIEANHKVVEAERYIAKKEAQGLDVTSAKVQIASVKTMLIEAESLLSQGNYAEAFMKAKEAHRFAERAKKAVENTYKEKTHDEDDEDDLITFPLLLNGNGATTSSSTVLIIPVTLDDNGNDIEDQDNDRKDDENDDREDDKDREDGDGRRDHDDDSRR